MGGRPRSNQNQPRSSLKKRNPERDHLAGRRLFFAPSGEVEWVGEEKKREGSKSQGRSPAVGCTRRHRGQWRADRCTSYRWLYSSEYLALPTVGCSATRSRFQVQVLGLGQGTGTGTGTQALHDYRSRCNNGTVVSGTLTAGKSLKQLGEKSHRISPWLLVQAAQQAAQQTLQGESESESFAPKFFNQQMYNSFWPDIYSLILSLSSHRQHHQKPVTNAMYTCSSILKSP
ncbi:hypothetical protein HDV62DRAFT_47554 [Trichoderma sp. SZMC 28011]